MPAFLYPGRRADGAALLPLSSRSRGEGLWRGEEPRRAPLPDGVPAGKGGRLGQREGSAPPWATTRGGRGTSRRAGGEGIGAPLMGGARQRFRARCPEPLTTRRTDDATT